MCCSGDGAATGSGDGAAAGGGDGALAGSGAGWSTGGSRVGLQIRSRLELRRKGREGRAWGGAPTPRLVDPEQACRSEAGWSTGGRRGKAAPGEEHRRLGRSGEGGGEG